MKDKTTLSVRADLMERIKVLAAKRRIRAGKLAEEILESGLAAMEGREGKQ